MSSWRRGRSARVRWGACACAMLVFGGALTTARSHAAEPSQDSRKVDEEMQSSLGAMTGGMKIPGLF